MLSSKSCSVFSRPLSEKQSEIPLALFLLRNVLIHSKRLYMVTGLQTGLCRMLAAFLIIYKTRNVCNGYMRRIT